MNEMPIYEYYCADCHFKTESLRPMSKADDPIECKNCHSQRTSKAVSVFAAFGQGSDGSSQAVAGAGSGCGSCSGGNCATCH